jgi:hypothetical protein
MIIWGGIVIYFVAGFLLACLFGRLGLINNGHPSDNQVSGNLFVLVILGWPIVAVGGICVLAFLGVKRLSERIMGKELTAS